MGLKQIFNTKRIAFTLLEVILAISIAGVLLTAAASLVVSISDVWVKRQDQHFFEDHVEGVTEFIQASFNTAGTKITIDTSPEQSITKANPLEPSPTNTTQATPLAEESEGLQSEINTSLPTGAGLLKRVSDPVAWSKPPGYTNYSDPLLHFSLKDAPPLLIQNENAPIIGVEAFLHFDVGEGLSLLWYTPLQENSKDLSDLRRTAISDLITQVEYIYWDEVFEKWDSEAEPKEENDQFIVPSYLKLTFEYQGETKKRILTIPISSQSALIF